MAECSVKCTFRHVTSNAINLISSSIGIPTKSNKDKTELSCSCSLSKAYEIRSILANVIGQDPQIWFSITQPNDQRSPFLPFNKNIGNETQVSFGSLLSTSKFLIHDTLLNDRTQWTIIFRNEQTLVIEGQANNKPNSSIRLTFPMKCVDKTILVIDGDTYSDIILNIDTITTDVRINDNNKIDRLYGNNPIIESLNRCSDILIRISSKSDADQFLNYLCIKHHCQIFYTRISIEQNTCKQWDKIEFNWFPMNEALYAISMLYSLGYLFVDKYFSNTSLQSTIVDLAENDERRFYQLAVMAFNELKKCHWLDLTTIFNEKQFNQIQTENKHQSHYVGAICLTPTRLYLMPKEKTKGNRAMRYEAFQGENNFCLVYLKPDPPEVYLTSDIDALAYFQRIFKAGIEIGRDRYHLFGASNSQSKEHSFWFIKASTLDEIDQKRLQLGQLDEIDNVGTYVARLGLWFGETFSTGIKLVYCPNIEEFNRRVEQRETCVMCIDDIERNNYYFTDGNGFISKGLAKSVAEKLSLISKTSQQDIFPSAYQIRLAGCKGLLIVDPQSTMDQFYIKIRPSMDKFKCNDWTLDICDYSRPTSTRLNRQIILLMSDLGVPDETFFRLQKQWFDKKPSRSLYSEHLLKIKIPLPVNECRFMYGCAFESRLKSGTCFIRYQVLNNNGKPSADPQFKSVEGRVIVTKNPCPYAGDMLELTAVDLPELHHLSDVIVFSTEGDRPDFNKIAGSDLDGDGYFVYWGVEFRLTCSVPPLDYKAEEKIKHPTRITPEDVIKYYLSTLGATSYGEIYNLHAVIVDQNPENHRQRTCQELAIGLARMFASAIDSGKTGYVIDKKYIQKLREDYGKIYPDFLMKYDKQYYRSQSIIGKLYRNAVMYKQGNIEQLNDAFAQLGISDERLEVSSPMPLNSLPLNNTTQLSNSGKTKGNFRLKSGRKSMQ